MSNFLTGLAQLNPQVKRHNGATTSLTLDQSGTTNATMLYVNGVGQTPGIDFNVSGTTLTTTSTLPAGTNIATTIQYFNTGVVNTVADATITAVKLAGGTIGASVGYALTDYNAGTKSSGTYTPDESNGNFQYAVSGGAHTLAPPSNSCSLVIQYTNNGSAGTVTTSGFTLVDGDSLTTTDGDDFLLYITRVNSFSLLTVKAMQ